MVPLYGFLQGDVLGVLVVAQAEDTMETLCSRLMQSCRVRVTPGRRAVLRVQGQILKPSLRLSESSLVALDRYDVEIVEVSHE